jgi:HSP20 family protein
MALVRWDAGREVDSLQSEMNRVFDAFFGTGGAGNGNGRVRRWVPAMDLVEQGDHLVLRADLPGMTEDDIEIEVKDGVLTLSGERRDANEEKADGYYRVERTFGQFSRTLTLPDGIDPDRITAGFDRGVLEVRVPKPEERKAHRIEIGTGAVDGTASES